ncbi:MAG: oxygen-independent coproporphyrinogen III oxidase [Candidatus Accumulibacter sp.]|jgi:oxygen-independent coproporphyrinogen-3 oxidase|nr:oxygen-independent coproporphyrinogen III oxidase [Accumulibacter sp.]
MNFASGDLIFDPDLVRRFDIKGPRYTSYPTADRFIDGFGSERRKSALRARSAAAETIAATPEAKGAKGMKEAKETPALSLYFHIPFCASACYFCACNKIVTKDRARSAKYLRALSKEMSLASMCLGAGEVPVEQVHWGGGTPTFLSDGEIESLIDATRRYFRLVEGGESSIEVEPRGLKRATVETLARLGFNRLSVGVQDFDADVQSAIHRVQSEEETRAVVEAARASGFQSIGVDLIYGLPRQSAARFARTLERIVSIDPDRVSVYNYAHLPALFKAQRRINAAELPSAEERLRILSLTIRVLCDAGYVFIGMDHFAKPDDELARAQREKRLHRNFQGYSTRPDCDMLAFGVSAISKLGAAYDQNVKTLDEYYAALDRGEFPVSRGIVLDDDDLLRRAVIQSLMCHFELPFAAFESAYRIDFENYFSVEIAELGEMEKAGLVSLEKNRIAVLPPGRILVRAISMVFDRRLREDRGNTRYSKII